MEVGKLYKVNAYAVSDECQFHGANRRYVLDHGWLWVCEGKPETDEDEDDEERSYNCRSIATGRLLSWYNEEVEELG